MKANIHFQFWLFILIVFLFDNCYPQEYHGSVSIPVYKGGLCKLNSFIIQNIKNAEESENDGTCAAVTLSYIVNEKGKVEDIKILRGINEKCDSEAVRVAKLIPDWQPAVQWGRPISARVIMPVEFKIANINRSKKDLQIAGKITDRLTGKSIEGALVIVKGTNIGAASDKEGYYSITVPDEETELEFSSIGYEMKSEKVGKNNSINAELSFRDFIIDSKFDELK